MRKPTLKQLNAEIIQLRGAVEQERNYNRLVRYKEGFEAGKEEASRRIQKSTELQLTEAKIKFVNAVGQALHANAELARYASVVLEPRQV